MKQLTFEKPLNLNQLHDELLAADPELIEAVVEGGDSVARITVPDEVDEAMIAAVVAAHDPAAMTPVKAAEAERTAATTDLQTTGADILRRLDATFAAWPTATVAQRQDRILMHLRDFRKVVRYLVARSG